VDEETWRRLYVEAGSMRELALSVGMTPAGVKYHLKKHGIEIRGSRPRTVPVPEPTSATAEDWQRLYDEAGSLSELARWMGRTPGTIGYHLRKHGIEIRRTGFLSPKSVVHYGADNHNWKGGTYLHDDGYVMEYAPHHPDAAKYKGYVLQHRLVMERKLGRRLRSDEIVHHKNEIKTDNDPNNLELTDRSEHMKEHKADAVRDEAGRFAYDI
jgi:hypothetical protein